MRNSCFCSCPAGSGAEAGAEEDREEADEDEANQSEGHVKEKTKNLRAHRSNAWLSFPLFLFFLSIPVHNAASDPSVGKMFGSHLFKHNLLIINTLFGGFVPLLFKNRTHL